MLKRGTVINRTYRIADILAHGGMSNVYLAESVQTGIPWVIKEVRTGSSFSDDYLTESLHREIDTLKHLEHPSLVRVVDALSHEGNLLMVMEYVEGRTLQRVLEEEGTLSEASAVHIAEQICDALGYLHSRGQRIIYRDLKPANIILRPDGRAVLIDFGTVLRRGERNSVAVGTPGFAAPEQFTEGARIAEETDIYAMGQTLIAMMTGGTPEECILRGVSRPMRHIISRSTSPRAKHRYRHMAEMHYALGHMQEWGLVPQVVRGARISVFLMFFVPALVYTMRLITEGRPHALPAAIFWGFSVLVFWRANIPAAVLGLFGHTARSAVLRRLSSARVNGVFMIGKDMIAKDVISWQDVEIPLDEPMTDVRIDFNRRKVKFIVMNGFTLERDVMVTLRENYQVRT